MFFYALLDDAVRHGEHPIYERREFVVLARLVLHFHPHCISRHFGGEPSHEGPGRYDNFLGNIRAKIRRHHG